MGGREEATWEGLLRLRPDGKKESMRGETKRKRLAPILNQLYSIASFSFSSSSPSLLFTFHIYSSTFARWRAFSSPQGTAISIGNARWATWSYNWTHFHHFRWSFPFSESLKSTVDVHSWSTCTSSYQITRHLQMCWPAVLTSSLVCYLSSASHLLFNRLSITAPTRVIITDRPLLQNNGQE